MAKLIEDIILIGIKTVEKAIIDKVNHTPVLKHVRFMAEKATKKMFEPIVYNK